MVEVDPVQLHVAGGALSAAADDAGPVLAESVGSDCGAGFPGTSAAAHAALVDTWLAGDRALVAAVRAASASLHQVADDYVGTDDHNASLLPILPSGPPSPGAPPALSM